ncbi:hypothetical protein C3E98_032325 [Pseudomonas sp. MWU13-2625]|nr:hypothetical protein C3E98_032325 [Pseudomonas sp. MWU13-2625]
MRAPLSDAAWRKAWNDLCMVGDPDSARPCVRFVVECAALALQDREQVRPRPRPTFDAKRCAANDFD